MDIVLVWDNKTVLEIDGDTGCKTMRRHLMPLNYTHLKMIKILCFMSCVFYHIKENNANHIYRRKTEDCMVLAMLDFFRSVSLESILGVLI